MKIQKIKIKNIASIEEAEIDFNNGPLASDPIFLISGDTGTGKSTILNSICLALYDDVPALNTIGTSESDHEGVMTRNSRQLMRKGSGFACVELTFMGNDDKQYIARWQVQRAHKKPKGAMQKVVRELQDVKSGTNITSSKAIKEAIEQVVGLTFEQFTRTTMLAQGQFATFMKADDREKSEILEKLTGTDEYTKIGKKINEIFKKKEEDYKMLDAQIKGANLLTDDVVAQHNARIQELKTQISSLDADFATVTAQLDWLKRDDELRKSLVEKQAAEKVAAEAIDTPQYKLQQKSVADWESTAQIRPVIEAESEAQKQLTILQGRLSSLAGDNWHRVLDSIEWLKVQKDKQQEALKELQAALTHKSKYASVYDNSQRIDERAKSATSQHSQQIKHQKEHDRLTAEAEKSRQAETPLSSKLQALTAEYDKAAAALSESQEAAAAYDMEQITKQFADIESRLTEIKSTIEVVNEYSKRVNENTLAQESLSKANDAKSTTEAEISKIQAQLPELKTKSTATASYLQGMMELNDHIASLRQRFEGTHECPLCGNTDAHIHPDDVIDEKVALAKAAADEAKGLLDEANTAISALNAKLKIQQRDADKCKKTADEAQAALSQAEANVKAKTDQYTNDDCIAKLEEKQKETAAEKEQAATNLKAATDAQNKLDQVRKALDAARDAKTDAEKKLENQKQKTKDMLSKAQNESTLAAENEKNAADAISTIQQLTTCATDEDTQALAQMLRAHTSAESISVNNVLEVAAYILAEADTYSRDKQSLTDKEHELAQFEQRISQCTNDIEPLTARFTADYAPTATECLNLEAQIRQLNADVNNIEGAIKSERQKQDTAAAKAHEWFAASTITRDEVSKIAEMTQTQVDTYKAAIKTADDALAKAKSDVSAYHDQLKVHATKKPQIADNATVDNLAQAKADTDAALTNAKTEKTAIETTLSNDQANRQALANDKVRLERLREEKNDWEALNKIFGNADGSLFRKIAQSYVLRALLVKANYYLGMLTRRYRLDCEDGSLTINVIDTIQGDAIRNVGLLSGGESFIVSLALALGLSAINKTKINVDTLFIDEGFGTLDKDTLDTVINTFDRLHNIGGRRIGIISHVQDLKDRIPTQICLEPNGPNSSKVVIKTL